MSTYRAGTYNTRVGRDPMVVADWVGRWVHSERLQLVALQEAHQYLDALDLIPGYQLMRLQAPGRYANDTAVMVREDVPVTSAGLLRATTRTWATKRGTPHARRIVPWVVVDDRLRFGAVHTPPGVRWAGLLPMGRPDRVAAFVQMSWRLLRFLTRRPNRPTVLAGDWNAPADARGWRSPRWLARKAGMACDTDGGLDWVMSRGAGVSRVTRVADDGGSDHHARTFIIRLPERPTTG